MIHRNQSAVSCGTNGRVQWALESMPGVTSHLSPVFPRPNGGHPAPQWYNVAPYLPVHHRPPICTATASRRPCHHAQQNCIRFVVSRQWKKKKKTREKKGRAVWNLRWREFWRTVTTKCWCLKRFVVNDRVLRIYLCSAVSVWESLLLCQVERVFCFVGLTQPSVIRLKDISVMSGCKSLLLCQIERDVCYVRL